MRTVGDVSDTLNSELNRLLHSNTINTPDMRKELYSTIRSVIGDEDN